MTIDESLEWLVPRKEHYEMDDNCQELAQALDLAISTMRKYQKIEQIVSDFREYQKGITWGFGGEKYMQMVSKVVEDGKTD